MMNIVNTGLIVSALALGGCATVGPGEIGVLWRASSGTQAGTYGEGLHAVAAWNEMYVYDLRSMSHDELLNVIAVNGLAIRLDASVRYRLVGSEIVRLHQEIGPQYYAKILEPVLRSEARRVIGRYTPEEIYSTQRDAIEREIRKGVEAKIVGQHIALEAILIRNIELPEPIRHAIDLKLAAEQEVLKMRYVLEVAKASADQRRIDATGVAQSNQIVAASLTPPILEYERILQLSRVAESPNAKTVLIGPSNGGTPIVLSAPSSGAAVPVH